MHTANPALSSDPFSSVTAYPGAAVMTVQGTAYKTILLLLLCLATASYTWSLFFKSGYSAVLPWLWIGLIGGLVVALVTIFASKAAPYTAPLYALLEGLALGGISSAINLSYPGIAIQAVSLTFATMLAMLLAYASHLIKVTNRFRFIVVAATGGIFLAYLVSFILSLFHVYVPFIYGNSLGSLLFSIVVVIIAALNLVLDFDFIARGAEYGAPKYLEWYGAFALMVTLVWLYIEILRLLAISRSRQR